MSDPLSPERPGSLAELGLSEHPVTPLDEMARLEEEAQAATAAEPTIPEPEALPPDQVEPEEAQQVEAVQEESILKAVLQQDKAPDSSTETRLEQENARLRGLLEGRLQAAEEQIRQSAPAQEQQPEPREESLLSSAPVRQVLSHLREEDPAEYEAAFAKVIREDINREVNAKLEAVKTEREQAQQQQQQLQQGEALRRNIESTLNDVKATGGLEDELVEQFYSSLNEGNPQASYLGKRFSENPYTVLSEDGIRGAVSGVAAELRTKYQAQQSNAAQVSPSVEASAGGGSPSTRGVSLGEKPKEISEEEQIIENMMNAGGRTKALGFLG